MLIAAAGGASCELTRTFFGLVLKEGRERIMQFISARLLRCTESITI